MDLSKIDVNKGITCSISLLTKRTDGLNPLVQQVNNLIEKGIESETNIDFINNDTISDYHLNSSGLHLNRKGDAALARNIIQYIKKGQTYEMRLMNLHMKWVQSVILSQQTNVVLKVLIVTYLGLLGVVRI